MGGGANGEKLDPSSSNVLTQFLTLLLAEKSGVGLAGSREGLDDLEKLAASLAKRFESSVSDAGENVEQS